MTAVAVQAPQDAEAPLTLGIYDFGKVLDARVDKRTGLPDARQAVERFAELARLADRLGYARIWMAEHHTEDSAESTPELMASLFGAVTTGIRIGTGVTILPYYSPLHAAENFRLLHAMYPGRVDMGIGRGPAGGATISSALSSGEEGCVTVESFNTRVEHLMAYLRETTPPGHPNHGVQVAPVGVPAPEVWMVGARENSLEQAARHGAYYAVSYFLNASREGFDVAEEAALVRRHYVERFQPAFPGQRPRVAVAVTVACAETEREAVQIDQHARRLGLIANNVVGSPRQCREQLEEIRRAYGSQEFIVGTTTYAYKKKLRCFELLAKACGLQERI